MENTTDTVKRSRVFPPGEGKLVDRAPLVVKFLLDPPEPDPEVIWELLCKLEMLALPVAVAVAVAMAMAVAVDVVEE